MASLRTQNALLFVIALCLVLLVVHFYSGHLVAKAYATADPSAPNRAGMVVIYGCHRSTMTEQCNWNPVRVDKDGYLLTK